MDNLEYLSSVMGKEKAKKVLRLTDKYDKFISKFRTDIAALLDPEGFEVKTGIAFVKKAVPSKTE